MSEEENKYKHIRNGVALDASFFNQILDELNSLRKRVFDLETTDEKVLETNENKDEVLDELAESVNQLFEQPNRLKVTSDEILNLGDKCDELECGDCVIKETQSEGRTMYHCYIVSYKEDKHGICLTYTAAGYIETISYDYINNAWVLNSKDTLDVTADVTTNMYTS